MKITKFLFDLGNVFFDWDPHYVFKNIIPDQTLAFQKTCKPRLEALNAFGSARALHISEQVRKRGKTFQNIRNV